MGRLFRIEVGYLRVECGGGEKILSEGEGSKCPLSLEYPFVEAISRLPEAGRNGLKSDVLR